MNQTNEQAERLGIGAGALALAALQLRRPDVLDSALATLDVGELVRLAERCGRLRQAADAEARDRFRGERRAPALASVRDYAETVGGAVCDEVTRATARTP